MSSDASAGSDLAKNYDPAEAEAVVRARWDDANVFHVEPEQPGDEPRDSYSFVIPPPNVTAALHLGHALNNTLQDVLTRHHRMVGDRTLWMPGTDHAGIATQTVVEKRLLSQGTRRLDMGRDAFIDKVQEWKDEYEATILDQLREMGASCDFDRTRFTMDEVCAAAVRHAFYKLFADDLIYRGKRLVNWDPVTRTALADDEVEMEDVDGHMWYLRYPLTDGSGHVTVATTRPETMLGDTAVAVNPNDPQAAAVRGKTITLPIVGRIIPIVEDDYVVMADPEGDAKAKMATGFLKVTPAHDPNDWEIGRRHDLEAINIMAADASISDHYGWTDVSDECRPFIGLSREDARTAIVAWFDDHDLLDGVRDHPHSVGHSYRSHVPIEPWLSDQWYVKVTDDRLRGEALRAMAPDQAPDLPSDIAPRGQKEGDGGLRFTPERYARTFQLWHENIRDWCISRQLWWGHQIPVWSRTVARSDADAALASSLAGSEIDQAVAVESAWSAAGGAHRARLLPDDEIEESVCVPGQVTLDALDRTDAAMDEEALIAALEADGFVRDADVLDTWFSSGLWPMSTMGWPDPSRWAETEGLLDTFNPTSLLTTAREIITLWVSRMVMFNRYFLDGRLPFQDVFIHAMIQDGHGQKMSKSLGNGVDPRDIIHSHGADAMRFTLVQMTTATQDVRMPVDMVCPHTGETFTPEFITTPAGHVVAAPNQQAPADGSKKMVSAYGVATGESEPSAEAPLARNTSSKFDVGRNFANKLWNATRFALGRLGEPTDLTVDISTRPLIDRWIIARLSETTAELEAALANYQFNVYADTLYKFAWNDVSDWYLEGVKPTIDDDPEQRVVLGAVLDAVLRLMHPVCPFVTETLWPHVSEARGGAIAGVALPPSELLTVAGWPIVDAAAVDATSVGEFARVQTLVGLARNLRSERQVPPRKRITMHAPASVRELIDNAGGVVQTMAGVEEVLATEDSERPAAASPITFEGAEVLLSGLVDEVDLAGERERLEKLIEAKSKQVGGFEGRLGNKGYVENAKPELVEETRGLLVAAKADLEAAELALSSLTA